MFVFPHFCYVPAFLLCGTTKGSSLDLHHHRHRLVYWTVRHPLCHRLKILLGRCFTSAFSRPPHSSCGRLHGGIPTFRPNSEDKPQARTRSTPYGSLLSQLPANQNSRNAAGLHGPVDGKATFLIFYRLLFEVSRTFIRAWWAAVAFVFASFWVCIASTFTLCGSARDLYNFSMQLTPRSSRVEI